MLKSIRHHPFHHIATPSTPLTLSSTSTVTSETSSNTDESPPSSFRFDSQTPSNPKFLSPPRSYKSLATLNGHVGSVSSVALCGEFVLSASQGKDIIVWQRPALIPFTKFGLGDGSVKSVVASGNRVFTAHQDSKIRAWKVSRSSENVFRLVDTLPTTKDYLGNFMRQSSYVTTRRHHKRLWIEHADTISCLAVSHGLIYSGSWDKTIKVWRVSDFKCLESIKAHDDAINGLIARNGVVYSASADGTIKAWGKDEEEMPSKGKMLRMHSLRGTLEGHKDVSFNSVVVSDDGRLVYGGGSDGYVMGWLGNNKGFEGWRVVCELRAHKMSVLCMCLVGEFLCSGSADKSICVWKREIGGALFKHVVIGGHEGPVKCLQVSMVRGGGGITVYSGSLDKSVRVWWVPNDCDESKIELNDNEKLGCL